MDRVPLDRLDREWQALVSGGLPARLRVWALEEPVLAAFASPSALIRFLHTGSAGPEKDAVLRALLARSRVDPLAARVVLQALRPGLKGLAKRIFLDADDVEQLWQLLLASVWEQIRTYPLERRPRRIAANLLLDSMRATLNELARERGRRGELPATPVVRHAAAALTRARAGLYRPRSFRTLRRRRHPMWRHCWRARSPRARSPPARPS